MKLGSLALSGEISEAAVSPNGAQVAFAREEVGGQSLWIRRTSGSGDTRIVKPEPGAYFGLTFSPDGKFLYYLHRVARRQLGRERRADDRGAEPAVLSGRGGLSMVAG